MPQPNPRSPPIPQALREMLKDYPEHVERLQQVLDRFAQTSYGSVGAFDQAVWILEGRLETFFFEARRELEEVKATGTAEETAAAKRKMQIMSDAADKMTWIGDKALRNYIRNHEDQLL